MKFFSSRRFSVFAPITIVSLLYVAFVYLPFNFLNYRTGICLQPAVLEKMYGDKTVSTNMKNCSSIPSHLAGVVAVNETSPTMTELVTELSMKYGGRVQNGGQYTPDYCIPESKVAIIIPYRNRSKHLRVFLRHFHPIMQRQRHEYRIIVVEQGDEQSFNRAMLLNIGYVEALEIAKFDCFVFHDVDHMLENDRNYYGCPKAPKLLGVNVQRENRRRHTMYKAYFGGVTSFSTEQYRKVNGHSNKFWGWGGEDDDSYQRVTAVGYHPLRASMEIGRYIMLTADHVRARPNPKRFDQLRLSKDQMFKDGLNTLKYELKDITEQPLYTHILVKLPQQPAQLIV